MGLAEKLSEWLLRRRERQEERNMRQVAAYFGSLLNKRRADAGAILQSVRNYRDCPEVTRKQAELLLEHRFFRYVYQTSYPEWRAVMDALKETRYGMREGAAIPRSVREAAESPMLRLEAQYKVLEYEYTRRNAPQPLSPEAQAERDAAHRLLNCCMREGDLDALKRLALKGEKPDELDSYPPRAGGRLPQARRTEPGMERGDAGRQPHRHGTDRVAGGGRAGKADAASRRPLREEDGRQTARRLSGSGEGGTGAAPRTRPPRLGRSAGSTEGDGGEVRADEGLCRYRPAEVGLPPERGQWGLLP